MKYYTNKKINICKWGLVFFVGLAACDSKFLDVKPDQSLVIPHTLDDVQGLMDNSGVMNENSIGFLSVVSDDDYSMTDQRWNTTSDMAAKNAYIWAADLYAGDNNYNDWKYPYEQIFYANLSLQQLERIPLSGDDNGRLQTLRGAANFYRAWAYYGLAQLYCKPYDGSTAKSDLGLPLRLEPDVNLISKRSSVFDTYAQIIDDLYEAKALLPDVATIPTKPSKSAAFALLVRTFLQMGDYTKALAYADSCLMIADFLLDYRDLELTARYPFSKYNQEVIFHSTMVRSSLLNSPNQRVDSVLYGMYKIGDLRREAFFMMNDDGSISFKGTYDGSNSLFNGITVPEVLLSKAECLARLDRLQEAQETLNILLRERISDPYKVDPLIDRNAVLLKVLEERRKELLFRGVRWSDLRRLNREQPFNITLHRKVGNEHYTLEPNSNRYVLPIPDLVTNLNDMPQNRRD